MRYRTLADLDCVVALGGGHGLGRVMSALSFLGPRLTGIVATTDNGGSTGRIRRSEGGIAWGDTRNCLNQLITHQSIASSMFEYRFSGNGELSGHNLGNLMLKALDHLSVRPLEAINLIRRLLGINAKIIPMTEQATDLLAFDQTNNPIYGEVAIDALNSMPSQLQLAPPVEATAEAIEVIERADLILLGPGSFLTSLMPLLLIKNLAAALRRSNAYTVYIDNLGKEKSPAAKLSLAKKIAFIDNSVCFPMIQALILGPYSDASQIKGHLVVQQPLSAQDVPYRHDRKLLRNALEQVLQLMATRTEERAR